MVLGKEPVFRNGQVAGYVTNAAFGYTFANPLHTHGFPRMSTRVIQWKSNTSAGR